MYLRGLGSPKMPVSRRAKIGRMVHVMISSSQQKGDIRSRSCFGKKRSECGNASNGSSLLRHYQVGGLSSGRYIERHDYAKTNQSYPNIAGSFAQKEGTAHVAEQSPLLRALYFLLVIGQNLF
jgi:hypothetical protein